MLAELEQLDQVGWSVEAQEVWRKETGYFRNNVHRMDYPSYRASGWRIGSGPIEAACKTVIGTRMKGAGMRWKPPATDAIATLRAAYLSLPQLGTRSGVQATYKSDAYPPAAICFQPSDKENRLRRTV